MKKYLILLFGLLLVGCVGQEHPYYGEPEFDWMPNSLQWEHNIRNCRSQPQCNASDLFNRTGYENTIA